VFLDNDRPDLSPPTTTLNFESIGLNFISLSPELKQVFFIGDGLTGTGDGAIQDFEIPAGATRLFLGTMDGYGWYNNIGSFEVEVVPVPTTILLLGSGLIGLAALKRNLKNNLQK
jgi:hypothetical protein